MSYGFHIHYPQSYFDNECPDNSKKYATREEAHEALRGAMKFLTDRYGGEWARDTSDRFIPDSIVYTHEGGVMMAVVYEGDWI